MAGSQVTQRRWLVVSLAAFALANLGFLRPVHPRPAHRRRNAVGARRIGVSLMSLFALGSLVGAAAAMRVRPVRPLSTAFLIWLGMPAMLVILSYDAATRHPRCGCVHRLRMHDAHRHDLAHDAAAADPV